MTSSTWGLAGNKGGVIERCTSPKKATFLSVVSAYRRESHSFPAAREVSSGKPSTLPGANT